MGEQGKCRKCDKPISQEEQDRMAKEGGRLDRGFYHSACFDESVPTEPSGEPTWAEVCDAFYTACESAIKFLRDGVTPGGPGVLQSMDDFRYLVGDFRSANMAHSEAFGVLVVMGAEQVGRIRDLLSGGRTVEPPVLKKPN